MLSQQNATWGSATNEGGRRMHIMLVASEFGTGLDSNVDEEGTTSTTCTMPKSFSTPTFTLSAKRSPTKNTRNSFSPKAALKMPRRGRTKSFQQRLMNVIPSLSPPRRKLTPETIDSSTRSTASRVSLPEKSILSGKGSDTQTSLLRMLSERSLVRKISLSLRSHHDLDSVAPGSTMSFTMETSDLSLKDDSKNTSMTVRQRQSSQMEAHANQAANQVPSLHRKELILGDLLGEGAFSKVMALEGIKLMSQEDYLKRTSKMQEGSDHTVDAMPDDSDIDASMRLSLAEQCPEPRSTDSPLQSLQKEVSSQSLVVKHLNRKLLQKPKEFQQAALDLAREAQILSVIDCPYIVKLRALSLGGTTALDSGRFNNFFLVLDRLDDTLDARIGRWKELDSTTNNRMEHFRMATRHAHQLACALEYLHERNFVFRDCKPPNVGFLGAKGEERVQLFDFGLCRPLPDSASANNDPDATYPMSVAGTVRYMSPEMQDQEPYNCKTDVYSFAITLYEMLCLQKPYGEILRMSHFREYICDLGKRPKLPEDLPHSLQQLLEESWCASIPQRLSMKQVKARLEGILDTELHE